jgi:hypothetical protein
VSEEKRKAALDKLTALAAEMREKRVSIDETKLGAVVEPQPPPTRAESIEEILRTGARALTRIPLKLGEDDPICLRSPDGYLILGRPGDVPVVTCELRGKWYSLVVIHPDASVEWLGFGDVDDVAAKDGYKKGSGYIDHAPNPEYVDALAESRGWIVDGLAFQLIHGQWAIERAL